MSDTNPKAEIIAIGSEFLHGGRTESNSLFLAHELGRCGIEVEWKTLVGDNERTIALAISTAVRRAKVVIITGGLGSTLDDCTRDAVATVTGRSLRCRPKALQKLKLRYPAYGRPLTDAVSRQAYIPIGAEILENPVGSAPGFLLEWKRSIVVALPGVSKEAQAMFESQVIPRLGRYVSSSQVLKQKVLSTFGLTELQIDERLQPILHSFPFIQLSLLASTLGVSIVLREWGTRKKDSFRGQVITALEQLLPTVRQTLGDNVYAEDNQTMESVVGQQLTSLSLTMALAESCTGGLLGHRLTQIPGSSSYLDRAYVCYSNQAKQDLLGIPKKLLQRYGAVSAPVAEAMAVGARQNSQTDIGVSVTGIAGPGGGSVKKPVGFVFIGIDGPHGSYTKKFQFHGDRQDVKMRASQAALNMVRVYLLNEATA